MDSKGRSPVSWFGAALRFARQPVLGSTVTFASVTPPSRHALQHRMLFTRRHYFLEKRELREPHPWLHLSFWENILLPSAGSASRATWAQCTQAPAAGWRGPRGGVAVPARWAGPRRAGQARRDRPGRRRGRASCRPAAGLARHHGATAPAGSGTAAAAEAAEEERGLRLGPPGSGPTIPRRPGAPIPSPCLPGARRRPRRTMSGRPGG